MKQLLILLALCVPCQTALANEPAAEPAAPHEQIADDFGREMSRMMLDMFDRALVEMRKSMLGETVPDARGKCDCKCPEGGQAI